MIARARDLLRTTRVRSVARVAVVIMLAWCGFKIGGLSDRADVSEQANTSVQAVLARSCGAASFAELKRQGLVEECRLAQDGELVDAIPDDELPAADAKPEDVQADVVEDDDTSTPADVAPRGGPTDGQVASAVSAYFQRNPLTAQPGYARAVQRSVATYLTANPPEPGRPPTDGEVRDAVRTVLLANPPAPGRDGANGSDGTAGRSVTSAVLDGCDVVFAYSDGTSERVGPVCGTDGKDGRDGRDAPAPTDEQVAQAVVAYCSANGSCTGPAGPPGVVQTADECNPEPGRLVTDVNISGPIGDPATITVSCTTTGVIPGLGD